MWTYAPSEVDASILGIKIEGWDDGEFISIKPESPAFTYKRAMDGSSQATLNKFQTYLVTFNLAQSSPSNTWLHLLFKLFRSKGIAFAMPILIRDGRGSTSFFATDCWFETEPDTRFGNTLGNATWTIRCYNAIYTKGGNGDNGTAIDIILAIQAALALAGNLGVDLGEFGSVLGKAVESKLGSFGDIL